MKFWVIALFALFSVGTWASAPKADFGAICTQLFQAKPALSNYSTYFTQQFQKKATPEEVMAIFSELSRDVGKCTSYESKLQAEGQYQLILQSQKGLKVLLSVFVDESSGLVSGVRLDGVEDPNIRIQSWDDVRSALNRLDPMGKSSAILETQDHSVQLTRNGSDVFAIGSNFKLYVLGALQLSIEKGLHRWDEILPLREEWKSLPSGVMQTWQAGKEVKLLEYAENMISLSDNTAADHLLYFLGREKVQAALTPMGNTHEREYLPFLSTLELFKLKWALRSEEANSYISSNPATRTLILDRLRYVPREWIGTNGMSFDQSLFNDKIEWFATTSENCEAMFWLASRKSPQLQQVLSKNVPLITDAGKESSHWAYAGYKGGSEPGIRNMTYLLESKTGKRGCLAVSWNNPNQSISEYRFMDIVKKTLKFAEQKF